MRDEEIYDRSLRSLEKNEAPSALPARI